MTPIFSLNGIFSPNGLSGIRKSAESKYSRDTRDYRRDFDLSSPKGYYSRMELANVTSPISEFSLKHTENNYRGCLIGGSIGDALGWPVEFQRLSSIKKRFGEEGIVDLQKRGSKAEITDDTQMTIFTADGLLKSAIKSFDYNELPDMGIVYESYKNWLNTQYNGYSKNSHGWISNTIDLYAQRAPGTTCTSAIEGGVAGSIENPINSSKGCGGVMRTAPAGLMYYKNPAMAFEVGARCAALTHGSPSAYLPAGVHSCMIANIINGESIEKALDNSIETLKTYRGSKDTLDLLEQAKYLAQSDVKPQSAIRVLGEGWHGDEAIAIAVYCVLKSPDDFEKALIMAVNHDGDSDSTGAIAGNILGAYLGLDKIPAKWKNSVELSQLLNQLGTDLYRKPQEIEDGEKRYPAL